MKWRCLRKYTDTTNTGSNAQVYVVMVFIVVVAAATAMAMKPTAGAKNDGETDRVSAWCVMAACGTFDAASAEPPSGPGVSVWRMGICSHSLKVKCHLS